MSCNGCRALRKGCSETCILRSSLHCIDSPESQAHATVFVAKFFGRASLMSFISNVPESQRPGLFQSLLIEASGRTVNPVQGAVGLLATGNWQVCQAAVETVLAGGKLRPIVLLEDDFINEISSEEVTLTCSNMYTTNRVLPHLVDQLDLSLSPSHEERLMKRIRRAESPSEGSGTSFEPRQNVYLDVVKSQRSTGAKLLKLFR